MAKGLTAKQQQVYDFIVKYYAAFQTFPSLQIMTERLGYRQKSDVWQKVEAIRAKGLLPKIYRPPGYNHKLRMAALDRLTQLSQEAGMYD